MRLLAVFLALAAPPPARTVAWAQAEANAGVVVDLHDYYGLTLRFAAAGRGATCAGLGARTSGSWRRFRCTAWFRADEGKDFPGVARATFVLVPKGAGAEVRDAHVTACEGLVCPVH